jgi:hypothetical protein
LDLYLSTKLCIYSFVKRSGETSRNVHMFAQIFLQLIKIIEVVRLKGLCHEMNIFKLKNNQDLLRALMVFKVVK